MAHLFVKIRVLRLMYQDKIMNTQRKWKSIKEIKNLKGKKVLLRVDINVPISADGTVSEKEDWRIRMVLPTIKYLIENKAKIILMAHLGRPGGKVVESLRLGPAQDKLSELLDISISRAPDCIGDVVREIIGEMKNGEVLLLENLRFHEEEEKNDPVFAKKLASLGEIYINDAFSDSHRAHASIVGIAKFLPAYAGLLLEKEIEILEKVMTDPAHPAIAIIGGAKIETKLPVIAYLLEKLDNIIIGGAIANDILKIKGLQVGRSMVGKEISEEVDRIHIFNPKIVIPADLRVEGEIEGEKLARISAVAKVGKNEIIYDIGPQTENLYETIISKAKTIIWNGPLGKFEDDKFAKGTKCIAEAIKRSHKNGAEVIIGGGETIYAIAKFAPEAFKNGEKMHISTGGGAMLEFLAGKNLPGIEVLGK